MSGDWYDSGPWRFAEVRHCGLPIVERLAPAEGLHFRDGRLNLLKVVIQLRAEAAAINAIARGRGT
jgi:hypothetical protein